MYDQDKLRLIYLFVDMIKRVIVQLVPSLHIYTK